MSRDETWPPKAKPLGVTSKETNRETALQTLTNLHARSQMHQFDELDRILGVIVPCGETAGCNLSPSLKPFHVVPLLPSFSVGKLASVFLYLFQTYASVCESRNQQVWGQKTSDVLKQGNMCCSWAIGLPWQTISLVWITQDRCSCTCITPI